MNVLKLNRYRANRLYENVLKDKEKPTEEFYSFLRRLMTETTLKAYITDGKVVGTKANRKIGQTKYVIERK
jgi:uncharacterized Fe-S cluster-containing radical SAM superfamily enzyme